MKVKAAEIEGPERKTAAGAHPGAGAQRTEKECLPNSVRKITDAREAREQATKVFKEPTHEL